MEQESVPDARNQAKAAVGDYRADPMRRDVLFDLGFLVTMWVTAALRDFDWWVVVATLWTIRVVLFERRGYRLVTRGRAWWPSKNPDHYR